MKTTTKFKISYIILKLMIKIMYKMQNWLYTINVSNRNLVKDSTQKELWKLRNNLEQFITDHWSEFDNEWCGVQSPEVQMINLSSEVLRVLLGYCSGTCLYKIDKD